AALGRARTVVFDLFHRRHRPSELAGHSSAPAVSHRAIRGADLGEELPEREIDAIPASHQLVRLDVTSLMEEDVLENASPQWGQFGGHRRETKTAIAMAKPVDGEITNDRHQPGRESCAMRGSGLLDVVAQPFQIGLAQRLTDPREYIHYVVIVLGVVPDRRENEAAIAIEKQVPRSVALAALQLDHPGVQGRSLRGVRPDIALDVADCNRGVRHDTVRRTAAAELLS